MSTGLDVGATRAAVAASRWIAALIPMSACGRGTTLAREVISLPSFNRGAYQDHQESSSM